MISLKEAVRKAERRHILRMLNRERLHLTRTAKLLGISRGTLRRKMITHQIKRIAILHSDGR